MSGFLEEWGRKNAPAPQRLPKTTIKSDMWDDADYEAVLAEMVDLAASEERLREHVETGAPLFADNFKSLAKSRPQLRDPGDVRPSHLINYAIMSEAMELNEYERLRHYSVGDTIGAAMSAIAMEPELEIINDRLAQEQKLAEQLAKQEQEIEEQQRTVDEMMRDLEESDPDGDPEGHEQKAKNYQANQTLLNQMMEKLAAGAQELSDMMEDASPGVRAALRKAMDAGLKEIGETQDAAEAWGLDRGTLIRLNAEERIALANRINTPRLRKIADLIGAIKPVAFTEQTRKTVRAREEVYDVSLGKDLDRVLPQETALLMDPTRKWDFYNRYMEGKLVQYELRGNENVAKGGIILLEDGSGSMHGEPEMWSKAISIVLLEIARSQKRPFYGVHFGSPGEYKVYDFREPKDITFERMIDWAEVFFNGGTDFMTPLSVGLDTLKEEYAQRGAVQGDIIMLTDGQCAVDKEWLKEFKEVQKKIGFRVYGVTIGGNPMDEPLNEICDGRVSTVKDLHSGEDMRDIFRQV